MLMVLTLVLAAAAPGPPDGLMKAIADYDRAQIAGDKASLERLVANDYLLVNSSGSIETKQRLIADYTAPGFSLQPFTVEHPIRRVWTVGAVNGGVATLRGRQGGKSYKVRLRFADVWARRGGRWQVVYTQAAALPLRER